MLIVPCAHEALPHDDKKPPSQSRTVAVSRRQPHKSRRVRPTSHRLQLPMWMRGNAGSKQCPCFRLTVLTPRECVPRKVAPDFLTRGLSSNAGRPADFVRTTWPLRLAGSFYSREQIWRVRRRKTVSTL